jgi:hypothetical protein
MNTEQFFESYNSKLSQFATAYMAYLETESEHIRIVGNRKFATYQSFKASKSQRLRSQRMRVSVTKLRVLFTATIQKHVNDPAERTRLLDEFDKKTEN